MPVSSFWLRAARFSGRVDFAAVLRRAGQPLEDLDASALAALGVPLPAALVLAGGGPIICADDAISLADARYPPILARLAGCPPVLHARGNVDLLTRKGVAVVGARRCTEVGKTHARSLARAVAGAGGAVVSGLAWGIDSAAHGSADGATIAVLGQGLGVKLGGAQGRLADSLVANGGLLLSEFPDDLPPARWTFPQRNRVIAGLAEVVVVVEAGQGSGSLITARWADELGRPVLAYPGSPSAEASQGCLDLLEAGARMVRDNSTVLGAAGLHEGAPADPLHSQVLQALLDASTYDQLLARSGLPMPDLDRLLAALELTGQVERLPGDRYRSQPRQTRSILAGQPSAPPLGAPPCE